MLNRIALRLATVRALRGRTIAGQNVKDSEIGPIEDIAADKPTPFLVVYTDDGHYHVGSRDLFAVSGDGRVETGWLSLVIEIAITQRMKLEGENEIGLSQMTTDPSLELTVDVIERQILAALSDPRDGAAWPEMWRRFATAIGDRESRRGSLNRDGVRFAGRQIVLQVKVPHDPPVGGGFNKLWADFLALSESDPDLVALVQTFQALLDGAELTEFERVRASYNLSRGEAKAMGLADATEGLAP